MKKLLKDKKGFTLIELVISLLIFVTMTAAVTAAVAPTLRGVNRIIEISELGGISDTLASEISADLQNAVKVVSVSADSLTFETEGHEIVFSCAGGLLMRGVDGGAPTPVLDETYYGGFDAAVSFSSFTGGCKVTVALSKGGGTLSENTYSLTTPLIR